MSLINRIVKRIFVSLSLLGGEWEYVDTIILTG